VVTADFRVIHHRSLDLISNPEAWKATYIRLAEKWADHLPDTGAAPEDRALRAEAEAACADAIAQSQWLRVKALEGQLKKARQDLREAREQFKARREQLMTMWDQLKETQQELRATSEQLDAANRELETLRRAATRG
jgi:hypothetical protein